MKILYGVFLALLMSALNACDRWFVAQMPELSGYEVSVVADSVSVSYTWEIDTGQIDGLNCLFRPGVDLDPVPVTACGQLTESFYSYSEPGEYQTSLELYSPDGDMLGKRVAAAVIKPIDTKTLTIHCLLGEQSPESLRGLSLRGSAIEAGLDAKPAQLRPFGQVLDGVASVEIPIVNGDGSLDFYIHFKGNDDTHTFISSGSLVPNLFGANVWVVPFVGTDETNTASQSFAHTRSQARAMLAQMSYAPSALDLSPVKIVDGNGLESNWADNATFMEIYVRGYQDSDGDGIGDLRGLSERLGYLEDLGITALWLMPIHESSDNDHGYAVADYRDIEDDYGTLADFKHLLDQAHQRGIAVIIDYLLNHSSNANPFFVASAASTDSAYRDWYIWKEQQPQDWLVYEFNPWRISHSGWYYGGFSEVMPDFNLRNPEVIDFHINNLRFWLNLGVDGFRFDAVGNLTENGAEAWENQPENHQILKRMHDTVHEYSGRFTVCESPNGFADYAEPDSCGRAFNFDAHKAIFDSIRQGRLSATFAQQLHAPYVDRTPFILSNHDSFAGARVWDQLDGNSKHYRLAAQTYLLSSRNPFTYYGEEIGISGGRDLNGDHALRVPMSWNNNPDNAGFTEGVGFRNTAANITTNNVLQQKNDIQSLYHHYRQLYLLRKNHPVIASGQLKVESHSGDEFLLLNRTNKDHRAVIVINFADHEQELIIETGLGDMKFLSVYGQHPDSVSDALGVLKLTVQPSDAVVMLGTIDSKPN